MISFLDSILSINGDKQRRQIIYDTFLIENFYLMKINKLPPKKYNNELIIQLSICLKEKKFNSSQYPYNSPKNKNKVRALYLLFITTLIFYLNDKLSSYTNFPLQK